MINALEFTIEEWQEILQNMGQPKFRAKQIMQGLIRSQSFDQMTNLPKTLQSSLMENYDSNTVKISRRLESKKEDTTKYLFDLGDGNCIEGVLMEYKYGNTICISTQVGCRMGCAFCASGLDGLARNLTAGEMLGQVLVVNKDVSEDGERAITNVVLMGSGEPLDNYDNVLKFLKLLNAKDGINISLRNVSLSTSGIVDKIYELAEENLQVNLTISLHAPTDELRERIMPINKKWGIKQLINAAKNYFEKTGRRVIFEYSMIDGINDSLGCADILAKLMRGFPSHVNVINLNRVEENTLKGSRKEVVQEFVDRLTDAGVSATLRRTMGNDIEGACGQLRRKVISDSGNN